MSTKSTGLPAQRFDQWQYRPARNTEHPAHAGLLKSANDEIAVVHDLSVSLTTKDTKSTKFGFLFIRTLRVLRDLRGEVFISGWRPETTIG